MSVVARIATLVLSGASGSRTWTATAAVQDTAGGSSVAITFVQNVGGATPPVLPTSIQLKMEIDNADLSGAAPFKTFTITPNAVDGTTDNLTFFFTSDGNTPSGENTRCGIVRMRIQVAQTGGLAATQYSANTDANPADVPSTGFAFTTHNQGWIRGTTTATVVVNKTSLNGTQGGFGLAAFTGTYQNMDLLFQSITLADQAYGTTKTITASIATNASTITSAVAQSGTAKRYNAFGVVGNEIDTRWASGVTTKVATISAVQDSDLVGGGTGFTSLTAITTQTLTINPDVTLDQLTNSDSGGTSHIYNRGNTPNLTIRVTGARTEAFSPRTADTFKSINSSNSAVEDTMTFTKVNATGVFTFTFSFGAAGNIAALDNVGTSKLIRWRDTGANTPQPADTNQYGLLSSLLNIAVRHLQLNSNILTPASIVTSRLASDIGFFSFKITDINNTAINGAVGNISLQDNSSLISPITSGSVTTDTINGNVGYTPLTAWSSSLPSGGWDCFASTQFTFNGNTTNDTRKNAGSFDFTLNAQNPNLRLIVGGGDAGASGKHFIPGTSNLLVGLALRDTSINKYATIDVSPTPSIRVFRFNVSTGKGQFLAADGITWTDIITAGVETAATNFALTQGGAADPNIWTKVFPAANSVNWGTHDLFIIGICYSNGTPYTAFNQTMGAGNFNTHDIPNSQGIML